MRYTLFLYNDESSFADVSPEDMQKEQAVYQAYIQELQAAKVFVDTDWLQPSGTATVLTLKDGGRQVQDGPYAETKEQLGGYFVIDVENLDEALSWAAKCPSAQYGFVEVRPSAMPTE
ncbi:MAG: YciI family protein [Myxococcota bacterium]